MEAAAHPSRVPSPSSVGFHRPRRRLLPMRMMRYAVYACAIGYALTGCMACCLKVFRARRAQTRRRAAFTFHRARRSLASCARARRHGHLCAPRVHRAGARSSLAPFSRACANPLSSLGVRARSAGSISLARAPAVALVSPHSHASHAHGPRRLVMAWCAMSAVRRRLRHCVRCERVFNFSLSRRKK